MESNEMSRALLPLFFLLVVVVMTSLKWKPNLQLQQNKSHVPTTNHSLPMKVPFILIRRGDEKEANKALYQSFEKYRAEVSRTMKGLSTHLEQAMVLEHANKLPTYARLSTKIETRIKNISQCFEKDETVLKTILLPIENIVIALPEKSSNTKKEQDSSSSSPNEESGLPKLNPSTLFQTSKIRKLEEENAYDMTAQVVAHLVRDWTRAGAIIRTNIYGWICSQLINRSTIRGPILVPGAGMGRLAYDIYSNGFTVEANELSPVMAAAANAILMRNVAGSLHPFTSDPLSNEVNSERRYDTVAFPDTLLAKSNHGSLSYTIGDFVSDYYLNQAGSFSAVCTCFFIDTATNIYEYIELIKGLLKPDGLWINVGPVQWHRNALLRPSIDELRDLISAFGFEIVHWKVDATPLPYRQDDSDVPDGDSFVRYTNFDAYRPLRFVVIRK